MKQLKKIDWEHIWADEHKSSVRILIDPAGTDYDEGSVVDVLGLHDDNTTYPLDEDARKDVLESLFQHENWSEHLEDA